MDKNVKQTILFINARPIIDINFCQFLRKYTQVPPPSEHVASFYFGGKIFYSACKNFSICENLIWTNEMWCLKITQFLCTFRSTNYKPMPNFSFPVSYFNDQETTNEYTLVLLLIERIAFLDAMSAESFQLILGEIFRKFEGKIHLLDLFLQIAVNGSNRGISKISSIINIEHLPSRCNSTCVASWLFATRFR